MKRIIAFGGSNSKNSINQKLAIYAAQQLNNCEIVELKISDYFLPLYGIDLELEKGIPDEAHKLNELFDSVDGFIVSLAEHNGSYSVAFKNVFDWLSRINSTVWRNKPVLLLATSPGPRGGQSVLESAKNSFPYLGAQITSYFSLPSFNDHFSNGGITNHEIKSNLFEQINIFNENL